MLGKLGGAAGFVVIFGSALVSSVVWAIWCPPITAARNDWQLFVAMWVLDDLALLMVAAIAVQAGLFFWQLWLLNQSIKDTRDPFIATNRPNIVRNIFIVQLRHGGADHERRQ
jgi:hypothetical protein